jgi:hypothetical protein
MGFFVVAKMIDTDIGFTYNSNESLPTFFSLQVSNFFIGLYFLSVVNKFGISTVYLGFASVCALAVLYIAGNVVETKGRSLEEIERELSVVD